MFTPTQNKNNYKQKSFTPNNNNHQSSSNNSLSYLPTNTEIQKTYYNLNEDSKNNEYFLNTTTQENYFTKKKKNTSIEKLLNISPKKRQAYNSINKSQSQKQLPLMNKNEVFYKPDQNQLQNNQNLDISNEYFQQNQNNTLKNSQSEKKFLIRKTYQNKQINQVNKNALSQDNININTQSQKQQQKSSVSSFLDRVMVNNTFYLINNPQRFDNQDKEKSFQRRNTQQQELQEFVNKLQQSKFNQNIEIKENKKQQLFNQKYAYQEGLNPRQFGKKLIEFTKKSKNQDIDHNAEEYQSKKKLLPLGFQKNVLEKLEKDREIQNEHKKFTNSPIYLRLTQKLQSSRYQWDRDLQMVNEFVQKQKQIKQEEIRQQRLQKFFQAQQNKQYTQNNFEQILEQD